MKAYTTSKTWLYKTKFDAQRVEGKAVLVFEGLDTFCKIALNGKLIGETDNMFLRGFSALQMLAASDLSAQLKLST